MTAGRLILDMPNPAVDRNGRPYSKAKLFFYQQGTTILQDVFTDATLTTPLVNPVVSDSAGRFAEVWGDASDTYDVKWTDANNATIYTFEDIQPLSTSPISADGEGVNAPAFREELGLGTASQADTGTSGHTLGFLDTACLHSGIDNYQNGLQVGGMDAGLKNIPPNTQDAAYTFQLSDVGGGVYHTSNSAHTWTIPPNSTTPFQQGDAIYLRSTGNGTLTIARGTGVALRKAGTSTSSNASISSYGAATLIYDGLDSWCIMGSGVS